MFSRMNVGRFRIVAEDVGAEDVKNFFTQNCESGRKPRRAGG